MIVSKTKKREKTKNEENSHHRSADNWTFTTIDLFEGIAGDCMHGRMPLVDNNHVRVPPFVGAFTLKIIYTFQKGNEPTEP